jgi:hypothetical protein
MNMTAARPADGRSAKTRALQIDWISTIRLKLAPNRTPESAAAPSEAGAAASRPSEPASIAVSALKAPAGLTRRRSSPARVPSTLAAPTTARNRRLVLVGRERCVTR